MAKLEKIYIKAHIIKYALTKPSITPFFQSGNGAGNRN